MVGITGSEVEMKIKEESAGSDEVLDVSHEKLSGAEFTFLHPGILLKVKNSLEEVFFSLFLASVAFLLFLWTA